MAESAIFGQESIFQNLHRNGLQDFHPLKLLHHLPSEFVRILGIALVAFESLRLRAHHIILKYLIRMQGQVAQARRLATEVPDPETRRRLSELADEIERQAREFDAKADDL
jgi:hypothetical protein